MSPPASHTDQSAVSLLLSAHSAHRHLWPVCVLSVTTFPPGQLTAGTSPSPWRPSVNFPLLELSACPKWTGTVLPAVPILASSFPATPQFRPESLSLLVPSRHWLCALWQVVLMLRYSLSRAQRENQFCSAVPKGLHCSCPLAHRTPFLTAPHFLGVSSICPSGAAHYSFVFYLVPLCLAGRPGLVGTS